MDHPRPTKLLCICTANRCRSVTLEAMLRATPGFDARSAGTHPVWHGRPITPEKLAWADKIILFEPFHLKVVLARFPALAHTKPILDFSIPDEYLPYDPSLIAFLKARFARYFDTPLADPIRLANWWDP
jgi:predicted protein tyrosine phosphatase